MASSSNFGKESPSKILSEVPRDKGFHFYRSMGAYLGIYATSLEQFSKLLEKVELRSIEFHMGRGDFEKWVRSLGDAALALQLAKLRNKSPSGENLRKEVSAVVNRRLDKLRSELQHEHKIRR